MIYRINKTKDYTVMSNYHFREKEMSLKAKGLLSLMLSLPDEWDYSIAGLAALSKDGRDGVMKALAELEEFGYLIRTREKNSKGQFAGYSYDVYEKAEKPFSEKPNTEKPNSENPPQLNTNINKVLNISSTNKTDTVTDFEDLWKMYPKKKGKSDILKSKKRLKEISDNKADIERAITNYKAEIKKQGTEERYIMHGSTFFGGRWRDYLEGVDEVEREAVAGVTYL